jgi:hypothetical protein
MHMNAACAPNLPALTPKTENLVTDLELSDLGADCFHLPRKVHREDGTVAWKVAADWTRSQQPARTSWCLPCDPDEQTQDPGRRRAPPIPVRLVGRRDARVWRGARPAARSACGTSFRGNAGTSSAPGSCARGGRIAPQAATSWIGSVWLLCAQGRSPPFCGCRVGSRAALSERADGAFAFKLPAVASTSSQLLVLRSEHAHRHLIAGTKTQRRSDLRGGARARRLRRRRHCALGASLRRRSRLRYLPR